ncbi:MAG: hypothetical protein IJY62_06710 [Clostridia bacterium]|nr:hypothetical protein [Clostridia bacterium]
MKKSAFISDLLFAFFSTFIVTLCLLRYLRLTLPASLLFAAALGVLVSAPVYLLLDKKRTKAKRKQKEDAESQKLFLQLALSSDKRNAEYFRALFTLPEFVSKNPLHFPEAKTPAQATRLPPPSGVGQCLSIEDRIEKPRENEIGKEYKLRTISGLYAIETPSALVFPVFTMRPADGDLIAEIIRVSTKKKKFLFCSDLSPEAKKLAESFCIQTEAGGKIYSLLKDFSFLPEHYEYEPTAAPAAKMERKKRLWFGKNNARAFFVGGVMLLLTSLITPFPLYYLIFGGILLSSAVLVRIFGYR